MANLVGIHEIVNGRRNYVIQIDIEGDGSGDVDEPIVYVDNIDCGEVRLDKLFARFQGFEAELQWDGPTQVPFFQIPDGEQIFHCWERYGGLWNTKAPGYNGDVNLRTYNLSAGDVGSMMLHFVKKRVPDR